MPHTTSNLALAVPDDGDADGASETRVSTALDAIDATYHGTTGHDHDGTAGHGPQLAQANTHQTADTDSATTAIHHTLGTGADQAAAGDHTHATTAELTIVLDGGGSAPTTGVKAHTEIPFACTVVACSLAADRSGSVVLDLGVAADFAALDVTTAGTSIVAGAPPTLSGASKSRDATLAGWTTALAAGQWLGVSVASAATLTRVALCLTLTRTI